MQHFSSQNIEIIKKKKWKNKFYLVLENPQCHDCKNAFHLTHVTLHTKCKQMMYILRFFPWMCANIMQSANSEL